LEKERVRFQKFKDLDKVGIIRDTPAEELPPQAWSRGRNVRFRDGAVEKIKGYSEPFGTPLGVPYALHPVRTATDFFWFYEGLNDVWSTDGTNHAEISKTTGAYSADADIGWNGGNLAGGVAILNNGIDTPQQWTGSAYNDKLADLANWPAGMTARVIRIFKQYAFAFDVDEGTGRNPSLLRWSAPADPGQVPPSWDYTDKTKRSGRTTLGDRNDQIIDALPLGDTFVIYKQDSVWGAHHVSGIENFHFRRLFEGHGLFSRKCVAPFLGKHFVVSYDNVYVHDGVTPVPVLSGRWLRYLFGAIDQDNFERTFVAPNYSEREMRICYPTSGNSLCNEALCWNWENGTVYVKDLPFVADIGYGIVDSAASGIIDDQTEIIDSYVGLIDEIFKSSIKQQALMAGTNGTKLYQDDDTETANGSNFTAFAQRDTLPLGADGADFSNIKYITEIIPRIIGTLGCVVNIYLGTRDSIDDTVKWHGPYPFTIGTDLKKNCRVSGRIIDIKFESVGNMTWKMPSYQLRYRVGGRR
jgi:hypothetical protein